MSLGDNIKVLRKKNKLTQAKLGKEIGKKEITIRKYESGEITPPTETLQKISEVLNVSIAELTMSEEELLKLYIDNFKDYAEKINGMSPEERERINKEKELSKEEKELLLIRDTVLKMAEISGPDYIDFFLNEDTTANIGKCKSMYDTLAQQLKFIVDSIETYKNNSNNTKWM